MRVIFRAALVVWLALVTQPALAAGTGGVDVSPYPGVVNGKQVTAFHTRVPSRGDAVVRYSLRNTTNQPAAARLFSASASRTGGQFTIGAAGSSPYISFPDAQVTLKPQETRISSFTVHAGPDGVAAGSYGAIVVEVKHGSIVQQAAVVVYLSRASTVSLPLLVISIAIAVLLLAGTGFVLVARHRTPARHPAVS